MWGTYLGKIPLKNLGSGLPRRLSLGGHGSLHLLGQLHVLHLHPLHFDAPIVSGFVQDFLKFVQIIPTKANAKTHLHLMADFVTFRQHIS